jgi:hypothetical protein
MGWERRGRAGNRRVYYRKKRVNGKVVSVYVGPGEAGERAEREDRERREAARKPASAPSEAVEVLQGATPQVVEEGSVADIDWSRFQRPSKVARRCRTW